MGNDAITLLVIVQHELLLFAAAGLIIGGIDDLVIDILFLCRRGWRNIIVYSRHARMTTASLPPSEAPGAIAIFVPAWQEADVIGPMLRNAVRRWNTANYRIFVGAYPNDPGTIRAVADASAGNDHVVLGINRRHGPTTKADCLNMLWQVMLREEKRGIMYQTHQASGARPRWAVRGDPIYLCDAFWVFWRNPKPSSGSGLRGHCLF